MLLAALTFGQTERMEPTMRQLSNFKPGSHVGQDRSTIFLLYRDSAHESLGKSYCQAVSAEKGWHDQLSLTEWKFEMLAVTGLRDFALAEINRAEVVIIATRAGEAMPDEVKAFISAIEPESPWPSLIVVLVSAEFRHEQPCPDYFFLDAVARRRGADLRVVGKSGGAQL